MRYQRHGFTTIATVILLCLTIIALLVLLLKFVLPSPNQKMVSKNPESENGRVVQPSILDANSGISRKDASFSAENTFLIKLSRKSDSPVPQAEYIPQYLTELLQLPLTSRFNDSGFPFIYNSRGESQITWNTRQAKPTELTERPFKRNYYLLLPRGKLDLNKIYEDNNVIATIDKPSSSVLPFLNDVKYCQQDSDCRVGYNFCSYGSYNYYQGAAFGPYGCGQGIDADYYEGTGKNYTYGFEKDPTLGCVTTVNYRSSLCINNRCIGQGRTVSCVNN